MASYNWEEIKAKYETGKYSMRELAEEYGFNKSYAARKARKNGWEKGSSKEKVQNEAAKKVLEDEANKEAKLRKEYEKILNDIRRGAYNTLFNKKDFNRLKQFKIASEIMRNCRKEQWEVNEILSVEQKANIENQEEMLEEFVSTFDKFEVVE